MTQNGTDPDSLAAMSGTELEQALAAAVSHLPDAHPVGFTMKMRGGAYDRLEVDTFMAHLAQATAEARAAMASAQQELAALRAENAGLRESGAPAAPAASGASVASGSDVEDEITAGAVGLLAQAQLIADKAVADAEQYARDLVITARNQYREILERAESSASHATASLSTQHGPAVPENEYVRTYAQVAQIQLRSVLEALTEQVDRLGSLPQTAPEPVARPDSDDGPVGEPDWEPSTSGTSAA
jgi:cell division septum initiation protein DivIVA